MTFEVADRVWETSTTVGAGDYTVAGPPTDYQGGGAIGANNEFPGFVTMAGGGWEVGIYKYVTGPNRVQRVQILASSNGGAAVNWGGGTKNIRCGWPAWFIRDQVLTLSVAGGAGTTILTQHQCRRKILIFTGVLTGNRVLEVDATPWSWAHVINSTTGAFDVTLRVTGQTGFKLQRGRRVAAVCDGTDVRMVDNVVQRKAADVASAATIDLNVDGDLCDVTGTTGITAITLEEGREVTTRFTGALTLTNGASLVLIGGANIATAAGDFAVWRGYAAGVVRMVHFARAAQPPGQPNVATQADMEAASSNVVAVTPGRFQHHPGALKAWARVNISGGVPSIAANYNVTSITDNGGGDFTVNFTTAFSSGDYGAGGMGANFSGGGSANCFVTHQNTAPTSSAFRVITVRSNDGTLQDIDRFFVMFAGDQ